MTEFSGHELEVMIKAVGIAQGIKAKQGDFELVAELEHIEELLEKLHKKLTGGRKRV